MLVNTINFIENMTGLKICGVWGKEIYMKLKRTTHMTTDRVLTGLFKHVWK